MNRRSTTHRDGIGSAPKLLELDAAAIAQSKLQIGELVAEIADLASSCEVPSAFYTAMLSRMVVAMAGSGAGVWQRLANGRWILLHSYTLPESLISDGDEDDSPSALASAEAVVERLSTLVDHELDLDRVEAGPASEATHRSVDRSADTAAFPSRGPSPEHRALLECVARERQPVLVPPGDIASSSDRPINPIQQCLIYSPIPVESGIGQLWLQVVQPPSGGVATHRGYLRFVAQIADLTADFLKSIRLRQFENKQRLFVAAEELLRKAAEPGEATIRLRQLMQQLRDFAGADQVILLRRVSNYQNWTIEIASELRDLDTRSDASQCLATLCHWITQHWPHHRPWLAHSTDRRSNEPTVGRLSAEEMLPQDRFLTMFSATAVAWLPLFGGTSNQSLGIGCLLYWSWPDKVSDEGAFEQLAERVQTLARLGLDAIHPPQLRVARDRAECRSRSMGHLAIRFLRSRSVHAALAAAVLATIALIPVPLRIVATATLQPRAQYRHYAPLDARITKVHVDYGQSVSAGQILLELEDRQLSSLLDDAISQQLKSKERRRDIEARLLRGERLAIETRNELEGELEALRALSSPEQERIEALKMQMDLLIIRAMHDGTIATWNARQVLQDRPVRVGQLLLQVQQPEGPWIVDAQLQQQHVGKFLAFIQNGAPTAQCALTSHPDKSFPAIYQPRTSHHAMLSNSQSESDRTSLCVRFAVPVEELPQRNAGSSARVTIAIGRGPLAWSVFGDAIVSLWAKVRLWI